LDGRRETEQTLDVGEALIPETETGHEHDADEYELRPEYELLPGVVFADLRQEFVVGGEHVAKTCEPDEIGPLRQVLGKEADEQTEETNHQHQPNPGMQLARRLQSAKQYAQRIECRIKEREPAQHQENGADRNDPVVYAGAPGISAHTNVRRTVVLTHYEFPPASLSAFSSSSSDTRFGPCRT